MFKITLKLIIVRLCNIEIIKKVLSYWAGNISIFMLHNIVPKSKIIDKADPNFPMYITSEKLEQFINRFKSEYNFISIDEVGEFMHKNHQKKAICLTIDDGYKNNIEYLLPILEKYQVPAVIYVCTKFLNELGNPWWFELWDFVKNKEAISLDNTFLKKEWITKTIFEKTICYSDIKSCLMTLSLSEQKLFFLDLTKSEKRKNYNHLFLDWDDVIELDKNPLITIGAHTHAHPILKMESYDSAYEEIENSKLLLEQKLGHYIEHFAYPFGSKNEVSFRDCEIVKKLNFKTAVTSLCHKPDINCMLRLPRYGLIETESLDNIAVKINGISNFLQRHLMI